MKQVDFIDRKNNYHRIDEAGNHFVNGRCVNPTNSSGLEIGFTYKHMKDLNL